MKYYGEYIDHNPVIDFDGSLFVFTGFGHRDDKDHPIVQKVIEKGGQYRSKVSGLTNYLVVDPRGAGDTKVEAAIEQREKGKNIQIVLLEDLEKALEGKTTAKKSSATSAKTIATKTSSSKSTSAKSTTKSKRDSSSSGKNSTETSKSKEIYAINGTTGRLTEIQEEKKRILFFRMGLRLLAKKLLKTKKSLLLSFLKVSRRLRLMHFQVVHLLIRLRFQTLSTKLVDVHLIRANNLLAS